MSCVGALRERVHEPEYRRIETPLVGRERLHVPAHQLPQDRLNRRERDPTCPPERSRPAQERALRTDCPERIGFAAARWIAVAGNAFDVRFAPLDLLA
jgi:hypothetical protein